MGSSEDAKVVSGLMDEIQTAIVDYQVSSESQTMSEIWVADGCSLLPPRPTHLVNRLPRRQEPVSDATN